MLSPLQQKSVWEGWLGAEVRGNYFADLSFRYLRQQRLATWLSLVFSSGALVTVLADLTAAWWWVRPVLAFVTAGISLWLLVAQTQRSATECSDLALRWNRLGLQYQALWDDMYAADALSDLQRLGEQTAELSKSSTAYRHDPTRMAKWQDHVVMHHAADAAA